ncbi:MAG: AAA family ATPase [Gammaproteobacteria bacterium]|nr:MAG: AAA family ATPase [Gammaproteobacteria bacterium]
MYLQHFGLEQQPFQLTPDADFLYLSKAHNRAKSYMEYTVWNRDGFVVITGEIGSGKTTLIQQLLRSVDESVLIARIYQTQLNEIEFFQAILHEFGLNPFSAGKVELISMLNNFLLEQYAEGRQVILIVDEAQNLGKRVLEELRMLTGMETDEDRILNLILVGQPELKHLLDAPGMEQLSQRIRFRFHLAALEENDIPNYIDHRLEVAGLIKNKSGSLPKIIKEECIAIIYRYTGGIPRLINSLCDTALICAFVENKKTITAKIVEEAVNELQWVPYNERVGIKALKNKPTNAVNFDTPAKLIDLMHENEVREYELKDDETTLGRIGTNDIRLSDEMVSGHHAKVIRFQNNYFIEDIASTNGSFVNGKRVHKCVLKDGDKISFGPYKLMFQKDADEYVHDPVFDMPNVTNASDTIVSVEDTLISGPVAANK